MDLCMHMYNGVGFDSDFETRRKTVSIDTHFTIPYIVIEQRQRNRLSQEAHNMLYRLI